MMKRERERERNECAREMMLIFRGEFCTPSVRSKSRLSRHAHRSLSLSLLFERFQSSRERDERETSALFRRERFRLSTLSLNAFLQISFPIKSSREQHTKAKAFLSREKMSRVCKMRDTKSTPKRLHANKKTKRERHYRTVCASENILLYISFSLRALKRVCL